MNKEELYIITDDSKVQLDMPSPSGITLKWVSNLFNDISKLTCSYSYTFKLPMTSNNRRALELADDIRHEKSMMKKAYHAEFYVNGVCLCPNANLYINETTDSFSCVMTWRVLKGFELMKNDSGKLNELPSLGRITWGGDESYGGTDQSTSNMDKVVYPDYDAGVPHMKNTPPKPCIPVYRLIQMINKKYGVTFNIGKLMENGMGMKPKRYFNNVNYYGYRVYDDYISNGVIPLVNSETSNERFIVRGIYGISSHTVYYKYLEFTEEWDMVLLKSTLGKTIFFYRVRSGTYTNLSPVNSDQLNATFVEPEVLAVGIPVFGTLIGNDYVKPLYAFQHNTGLFFFNQNKGQKAYVDSLISSGVSLSWGVRKYVGHEQITDEFGTSPLNSWGLVHDVKCEYDTTGYHIYNGNQGHDSGSDIGIVGFFTRNAFTIKGTCDLRISKSAVVEGRINVNNYMWICIAAVSVVKKDNSDDHEIRLEPATEKSINSSAGFQSIETPKYDETTESYICHFEFGSEYDIRKIEVDSNDEDDFVGYVFLPYFPEDYIIDVDVTDENGNTNTVQKLNLKEGDLVFENIVITELSPSVDVSTLPALLRIIESLPQISCFDFMKSVFYMNGAMPRVERDGETITAMYYNQLRDRVNDGEVLDWSEKLLSSDKEMAKSSQYHNTKFAKNNFLEMSKSSLGKTEEEILDEFDQYGNGYGNIKIDDDTLNDEMTIFKSSFYPAFIQNLRYPLIKVGNTCKIWEGDNAMESNVPAIYGYMVYRTLDYRFEDTSVKRPQNTDITKMHKRMNIFSPFDDEEMMDSFYGYLSAILGDYQLVKEQFSLHEIDLRDFDESIPVYLSKYNAYFAVSSIQRDKNGVSTVELVKLPRAYDAINEIDNTYSYEILSTGSIEIRTPYSNGKIYYKRTKDSAWEELSNTTINYGDTIYAIASEVENNGVSYPTEMSIYCKYYGKYRFTCKDPNTGEDVTYIKSGALAYFDGKDWTEYEKDALGGMLEYHTISENDLKWHNVEIVIPIRNQFDEIVETNSWTSPILVSGRSAMDGYDEDGSKMVITSHLMGRLHVNLIRDYTSNQTAIYSSRAIDTKDGNCDIDIDAPIWAYPYEASRLKGDSYTLKIQVTNTLNYTITRYKNGVVQSTNDLSVKLRTYYDDERMLETTTKTYSRSEFGQYHTIKYECDLVDENGIVVKKIRRRVIWFVSEKIQSVVDSPYGKEHNDDVSIKVNEVEFDGLASIIDKMEHAYTMKYKPYYADIGIKNTNVSVSDEDSQIVDITAQSQDGFTIRAKKLPENEVDINIDVEVICEDNSVFVATKVVSFVAPQLLIDPNGSDNVDIDATNGSGTKGYYVYAIPGYYSDLQIKSITSSNSIIVANIVSSHYFTLNVNGISNDEISMITVTGERNGETMTSNFTVKAIYKETWSTEYLDNAQALITDRNGTFYTREEWEKSGILNDDADGVAVSDGTHRFVVAKKDASMNKDSGYWSTVYSSEIVENTGTSIKVEEKGLLITGITTTTDKNDANTDYLGKTNTDNIVSQDPTPSGRYTNSAAELTRGIDNFPSGKVGYLGACGEWKFAFSIREKINTLLNAIGGTSLDRIYWTSTQYNDAKAWYYDWYSGNYPSSKNSKSATRAFGQLTERVESIKRGSIVIIGPDTFDVVNGKGSQSYYIQYAPSDASMSELSIKSDNIDVVVNVISTTEFELLVNGSRENEEANITVTSRVNGLIESKSIKVTAIVENDIDYDKLDTAHVLIVDKEYKFYNESEWKDSTKSYDDVEGIAVSDGGHRFIIALRIASKEYWGGRGIAIPGLSSKYDYLGRENTDAIISAVTRKDGYITSSNSAAEIASSYVFPSGGKGYLGSSGEWGITSKYLTEIQKLMQLVGGEDFVLDSLFTYWSSTGGGDEIRATAVHCYDSNGTFRLNTEIITRNYDKLNIRAFLQF